MWRKLMRTGFSHLLLLGLPRVLYCQSKPRALMSQLGEESIKKQIQWRIQRGGGGRGFGPPFSKVELQKYHSKRIFSQQCPEPLKIERYCFTSTMSTLKYKFRKSQQCFHQTPLSRALNPPLRYSNTHHVYPCRLRRWPNVEPQSSEL